jgi:hypothetical protein
VEAAQLLRPEGDLNQMVKLRGTVLNVTPGVGLHLRTGNGSLLVQTAQPLAVSPGDQVEVLGFPTPEMFRPVIRATQVQPLGLHSNPAFGDPLTRAAGIGFSVEETGKNRPLDAHAEHHVHRIACEAVSYATKHSAAQSIRVLIRQTDSRVVLEIQDDGKGMGQPAPDPAAPQFGIASMKERARKLGIVDLDPS